jgi:hypothetical protein
LIKFSTVLAAASCAAFAVGTSTAFADVHVPRGRHFTPIGRPLRENMAPRPDLRFSRTVWQPVKAAAPFGSNGAGTAMLMTDGTVMIQDNMSSWYRLTPDNTGSYINGTWSTAPSLPSGYGPLYFSSAILPDGRLIVNGGEYNFDRQTETNLGAIYDPLANTWTSVAAPSGWGSIGDAPNTVLPNGTLMMGSCCSSAQALLDAQTLTWTPTGSGKADPNSEEGWTLLPTGNVLTVDVLNNTPEQSELYVPGTGAWHSAGNTKVELVSSDEYGAQVLRPDGTVFVEGATGFTALYNVAAGSWKAGPNFPIVGQQLDVADGPAALLPDGNILCVASPGVYNNGAYFFEFNGKKLIAEPGVPNSPKDPSYVFRMLELPTGQILQTDSSNDVEVYTHGGKPNRAWAPTISTVAKSLNRGTTYQLSGVHLNGFSQGAAYGDDAQAATNYPLVRITNGATGHVFYARTHDFSSMAVASPATVSTSFDVPTGMETGKSSLVVVTNGIPSDAVDVTVKK